MELLYNTLKITPYTLYEMEFQYSVNLDAPKTKLILMYPC